MSDWRRLLDRTLQGLAELERQGNPRPDWVLGGGTALMVFADHRLSRDIDAFIDDPQHLALLSPETTDVWNCTAWDRAAHYLKLKYPEGEIDFVVTAQISSLPPIERQIDLTAIRKGSKPTIQLDSPVEIALKKLHYRATMIKARDVFDISVVEAIAGDVLIANLHHVAEKKRDLLRRLNGINRDFLQAELAELDIRPAWEKHKKTCLQTVRGIVERIP
ncbi:nucleotidyl transferase AbiEii/AbiGii toxin family protein [Bradyrhizobium sp.]|uniref:nucleotidyl transferase AbiEii/AbiGii toxin family protein n=1 Tax=Bradyrhizobium sp. TaxID=376 RepID=UPI003C5EB64A